MIESNFNKRRGISSLFLFSILFLFAFSACDSSPHAYEFEKSVALDSITPIGMTFDGTHIWMSDGDNNRLVKLNQDYSLLETMDGFERPMHMSMSNNSILVAQYGSNNIHVMGDYVMPALIDTLDAPAGVDFKDGKLAIADFYNHRILFHNGSEWKSIGTVGQDVGQLYYPTDVQLMDSKIYVADAYNNRIQVFSEEGQSLQIIGDTLGMNAATGLLVTEKELFVCDFENNRVLVFDKNGSLLQELKEGIDKPTDALVINGKLHISNYKGKSLTIYK